VKPTMAESKGPIAEVGVAPTPIDQVRRPRPIKDEIAPLSSRFFATFIDILFVSFVVLPLLLLVGADILNGHVTVRALAFVLSFAVVSIGYHTALEGAKGVTLGKWLMQIAVVKEDLTAMGMRRSAIRNTMRLVDALPYVVPYLLGAFIASASQNRQRWGDRIAKTIVVNV